MVYSLTFHKMELIAKLLPAGLKLKRLFNISEKAAAQEGFIKTTISIKI